MLGTSCGIAIEAVEAFHPLLLGALGGGAPGVLSVGERSGVKAAPNRLAVDVELGGDIGKTLAPREPGGSS